MPIQRRVNPDPNYITNVARPVATPADRMVTPEAPEKSSLIGLANALSSFDPTFRQYAKGYLLDRRDRMEQEAQNAAAAMSPEERQKAIKDGTLEYSGDKVFDRAFINAHGLRQASDIGMAISEQVRTGQIDLSGDTNVSQVLAEKVKEFTDGEGKDNPELLNAFRIGLGRFAPGLAAVQQSQRVQRRNEELGSNFVGLAFGQITQMRNEGKGDDEIAASIFSAVPKFAEAAGAKNTDLDRLMAKSVIPALADRGEKALVRKLLTDDRGGIGAIANKADVAPHAQDLIDRADKKWVEKTRQDPTVVQQMLKFSLDAQAGRLNNAELEAFNRQYPGVLSENKDISLQTRNQGAVTANSIRAASAAERAQRHAIAEAERARREADRRSVLALDMQGTVAGAQAHLSGQTDQLRTMTHVDSEGRQHVVTVEEQLSKGLDVAVDFAIRQKAGEMRTTPDKLPEDAKREATIEVLSRSGATYAPWKATFGTLAARLLTPEVAEGKIPQGLEQQFDDYDKLFALNPELARRHAGEDNANTFRAIQELRKNGYSFQEAMRQTVNGHIRQQANPALMRMNDEKLALAAKDFIPGWISRVFGDASTPNNITSLQSDVLNLARSYVSSGAASQEEALQRAAKEVAANTTNIKGTLLNRNSYGITTPERDQALKAYLQAWGAKYGGDAYVVPSAGGTNRLMIAKKHPENGYLYGLLTVEPETVQKASKDPTMPYVFSMEDVMNWWRSEGAKKIGTIVEGAPEAQRQATRRDNVLIDMDETLRGSPSARE
ncbi:MAG: hypothetical protein DI601_03800 [Azospirillum brasilense]|nr:MAG: hypothetical protein DI601_03800 [Azospirillum brasilense]